MIRLDWLGQSNGGQVENKCTRYSINDISIVESGLGRGRAIALRKEAVVAAAGWQGVEEWRAVMMLKTVPDTWYEMLQERVGYSDTVDAGKHGCSGRLGVCAEDHAALNSPARPGALFYSGALVTERCRCMAHSGADFPCTVNWRDTSTEPPPVYAVFCRMSHVRTKHILLK